VIYGIAGEFKAEGFADVFLGEVGVGEEIGLGCPTGTAQADYTYKDNQARE
jgi:hypothetical protein